MAAFFQFLLIIFLAIIFIVGTFIYRVYRQIHDTAHQFKKHMENGRQDNRQSNQSESHYGDDEVVIDRRDPDEANRKIFSKKEGEYVYYKEDK